MESSTPTVARSRDEAAGPRTETERILAGIWSEVLKTDRVGIYDDFIDLGGHSLSATLCVNRIREVFSVALPLELFFLDPANIAELASEIDSRRRHSVKV